FAQGIRGFACLLVVWNHLAQLFPVAPAIVSQMALVDAKRALIPTPWDEAMAWLSRHHVNPGPLGVSLFFLTSGFVIPFSLRRGTLRGFFLRRLFRLYPTYWLVIAASILLLLWESRHTGVPFPYHWETLVLNGMLLHQYAGRPSLDGVNWTLAIEELFYACAALMAWRQALTKTAALLGLAGLALGANIATTQVARAPLATMLAYNATMVTFILIGVALHHNFRGDWSPLRTTLVATALVFLFMAEVHIGPVGAIEREVQVSYSISLAVFVAAFVARGRLPRARVVNWLAEVSYPLYLVHPILGYIVLDALQRATGRFLVALPVTMVVVMGWAYVLHVLIEGPFNRAGRRLSGRIGKQGSRPDGEPFQASPG
ncbi:MAG: acyltransferase, partial [Actinobacteria bacterium]|nr:acyltransferase [Actinomycetota bacterium]